MGLKTLSRFASEGLMLLNFASCDTGSKSVCQNCGKTAESEGALISFRDICGIPRQQTFVCSSRKMFMVLN
jgi:hypothetical protein